MKLFYNCKPVRRSIPNAAMQHIASGRCFPNLALALPGKPRVSPFCIGILHTPHSSPTHPSPCCRKPLRSLFASRRTRPFFEGAHQSCSCNYPDLYSTTFPACGCRKTSRGIPCTYSLATMQCPVIHGGLFGRC